MNVSNMLRLQTQVAHEFPVRPPVQPSSSKSSTSSLSSSPSSRSRTQSDALVPTSPQLAGARCVRCKRSVSIDIGSDTISYGQAMHYCRQCTAALEERMG